MPWKMDGDHIAMQDGKPIWIGKDGAEAPFDAEHALSKISELNSESANRKRELREAQEKLKAFEGIEDPAKALEAIKIAQNLKDKQLIDAGEAEKVKAEAVKAMQAKIDEATKARETAEQTLHREMIGGRFARSKFIQDKLAIPGDLVEAAFGKAFQIKDGKVVASYPDGREVFSREKPGDLADFDEALSILVDSYPNKAAILKGSDKSGGGASGGKPDSGSKRSTYTRQDLSDPEIRKEYWGRLSKGEKVNITE